MNEQILVIEALRSARRRWRGLLLGSSALVAHLALGSTMAAAGPQNGAVSQGQATITAAPNLTTIKQSTPTAAINWQSFSVGTSERVDFQQPSSSSSTLNRVTGPDASVIAGKITANGQVLLVNQNGVLFDKTSQVDVGGLIATTSGISDQNYAAGVAPGGRLRFDQGSTNPNAMVVNRGSINVATQGYAVLSAAAVDNSGTVQAQAGSVVLGGAKTFTVDLEGDKLLQYQVSAPVDAKPADASTLVNQRGTVQADGGTIILTARAAKGVVDQVINSSGLVQAKSARNVNGVIVIDGGDTGSVSVTGPIDVSGANGWFTGGTAKILGDSVSVGAGATIDASGVAGGGTILVGGDAHGAGPEQNATTTSVASGVTLNANATDKGDGGKVVVWSNKATTSKATITARGGAKGGDGGWVETSSASQLIASGTSVDTRAPLGRTGTWLLDPSDITIGGTDTSISAGPTFSGTAATSVLSVATLQAALTSNNVTVDANAAGGTGGTGSITVASAISSASGKNLTLNALTSISIASGAPISLTGGGSVALQANGAVTVGDNIAVTGAGSGGFSVSGMGGTGLAASFVQTAGTTLSANGGVSIGATTVSLANVTAKSQDYSAATSVTLAGNYVTTNGAFVISGASTLAGPVSIDTSAGNGSLTLGTVDDTTAATNTLAINAGNGTVSLGAVGSAASIFSLGIVTTGNVTLAGNVTTGGSTAVSGGTAYGVSIAGPVYVSGDVTINTSAGNSDAILGPSTTISGTVHQSFGSLDAVTAGSDKVTIKSGAAGINVGNIGVSHALAAVSLNTSGYLTLSGTIKTATAAGVSIVGTTAIYNTGLTIDTSTGNGGVTTGGIYAASGAARPLVINAGAGAVSLGTLGAPVALGSVSVSTSAATTLGGGVTTSGAISITGPIILGGAGTINNSAGTGAITLGTVNDSAVGTDAFVIAAGTNSASVGAIGGTSAVASVAMSGAGVTLGGGVTAAGAVSISAPITLGGAVSIDTHAGNGSVALGAVDDSTVSTNALAINAGSGTVSLGAIGGALRIASFSDTGTGAVTLGGNVKTGTTAGVAVAGPIIITNTTTIDTSAGNGTLTLGNVDASTGAQGLALLTGTGVTTLGIVGGTKALSSVTQAGGAVTLGGGISVSGLVTIAGPITLSADAAISGQSVSLSSVNDASAGAHVLSVTAGTSAFSIGAIGAASALGGVTLTDGIGIMLTSGITASGATNGNISISGPLTVGGSITIGNAAGTGAITIGAIDDKTANTDALTIANGGNVVSLGTVGGSKALKSLTVTGSGGVSLTGAKVVSGSVSITGGTTVTNASTSIQATGSGASGGITLAGVTTTAATDNVTLDAGGAGGGSVSVSGAVSNVGTLAVSNVATGGTVAFSGATQAATSFTADTTVKTLTLAAATFTNTVLSAASAAVSVTGASSFGVTTLTNASISSAANNLTFGAITLQGGGVTTISSSAVVATGAVNATTAGSESLVILGGPSSVSLGNVGAGISLGSVSITGTAITVGSVTTSGAQTYTGGATVGGTLTSGGGVVSVTGATTLASGGGTISAANVTLSGAVTTSAGAGLTITASGATAVLGGATNVASVGITATTISTQAVTTTGNQTYTGNATVAGTLAAGAGTIKVSGTTSLAAGGGSFTGGSVTLSGAVTGAPALSINVGAGAALLGSTVSVASVGITAGATTLSGNVIGASGAVTTSGATVIANSLQITSAGTTGISLGSITGGAKNLTLDAGSAGGISVVSGASSLGTLVVQNTGAGKSLSLSGTNIASTLDVKAAITSITQGSAAASVTNTIFRAGLSTVTLSGTLGFGATTFNNTTLTGTGTNAITFGATTLAGGGLTNISDTTGSLTFGAINATTVNTESLSLTSGAGQTISTVGIGGTTALASLTETGGTLALTSNVTVQGAVSITGATVLANSVTVASTNNGTVTFGSIDADLSTNNRVLTVSNGTGGTSLGVVGGAQKLAGLTVDTTTSTNTVTLGGNISVTGTVLLGGTETVAAGTMTIDTSSLAAGGTITLGKLAASVSGNSLALKGGATSGTVSFDANTVGGHNLNLALEGGTIATTAGFTSIKALTLGGGVMFGSGGFNAATNAPTTLTIDGNVSSQGGAISIGTATLNGSAVIDTTSGAATGAAISITQLDSATANANALTLVAGTAGGVSLGAIGGTTKIASLAITSAGGGVTLGGNISTGGAAGVSITPAVLLNAASVVVDTSTGAGKQVFGTIDDKVAVVTALTLNAGTGTVSVGAVGSTTTSLGSFAVTAAGVTLGGNVTTNTTPGISISGPTTLTANVTMNSVGKNITLGAVDSDATTRNLSIINGAGVVSVGAVGATHALGTISIGAGAGAVTFTGAVNAATLDTSSVSAGGNVKVTGIATLTGGGTDVVGGSTAYTLEFDNTVNATGAAAFSTNSGSTVILGTGAASTTVFTFSGGVTGAGTTSLAGTLSTAAGAAINLGSTGTLALVGNNDAITSFNALTVGAITGTGAGGQNLSLATTSGNTVTFNGSGGTKTFNLALEGGNILGSGTLAVAAGAFAMVGQLTLGGGVNFVNGATIATGPTVTIDGAVTSSTNAALTFANILVGQASTVAASIGGGALSIGTINDVSSGHGISLVSTGSIATGTVGNSAALASFSASGTTISTGATVSTTGNQSYTGTFLLTTSTGLASTGGTITLGAITGGSNNLTLTTGSASASVSGAVTGVGTLAIVVGGAGGSTFSNSVSATSVGVSGSGAGTVAFTSSLSAGTLSTATGTYGLTLANTTVTETTALTTLVNTGAISISGLNKFVAGLSIASASTLSGTISTSTSTGGLGGVSLAAVTLGGNLSIDTSASSAAAPNVSLASVAGASALTINASSNGLVTLGNVGVGTALTGLTISTASGVSLPGNVTIAGANGLTISQPITTGAATTIDTSGGTGHGLSLGAVNPSASTGALTLTAGAGTISTGNLGASTSFATIAVGTAGAAQTGAVTFGGTVTATTLDTSHVGAGSLVKLVGTLAGTQITTTAAAYGVELDAGATLTGASTFTNTGISGLALNLVGVNTTKIAGLSVSGGTAELQGTLEATAGSIGLGGTTISSASGATAVITADTGAGAISLGAIAGSAGGNLSIIDTSAAVTLGGAVTNIGTLNVNAGTTLLVSTSVSTSGAQTYTGASGITLGNATSASSLTATGGTVSLASAATLAGDVSFDTSSGAGGVSLASTLVGAGHNLGIKLGTGNATITGAVSGVGAITLASTGATANSFGFGAALTAGTLDATGLSSAAARSVVIAGLATLTSIATAANNYSIAFNGGSTISNAASLINTGGLTLSGTNEFVGGLSVAAGDATRLTNSAIVETDGAGLTLNGPITLATNASLLTTANAAAGATLITGAINADTNGYSLVVNSGTSGTTNLGAIGQANISSGNIASVDVTGAGITMAAVATTGNEYFHGPLTLGGNLVASAGNITIDAGQATTIAASLTIQVSGNNLISLGTVTDSAVHAHNLTLVSGGAGSTVSVAGASNLAGLLLNGSGATTFSQAVSSINQLTVYSNAGSVTFSNTLTANKFSAITSGSAVALTFNGGTITQDATTLGGAVSIGTTGGVTINGPMTFIDGLTRSGGNTTLAGTLTSNSGVFTLSSPTILSTNATIDTTGSGSGAAIAVSNSIDGGFALNLKGGTAGAITLTAVGQGTPLASLTANGASILLNGSVSTTGNQSYTGAETIGLSGGSTVTTLASSGGSITLNNNTVLNTATSIGASTGISLQAVNGLAGGTTHALQISSTSGAVTVAGAVSNLTSLDVTSAATTQFQSTVQVVNAVNLHATAGSVAFQNTLTANALTTGTGAYALSLNGSTIATAATLNNTLGTTFASTNDFQGGLTNNYATSISGKLETEAQTALVLNGATTLTNATTLATNATGTGGNITLNTVDGGQALTIDAGSTGVITATSAIGTTALASLTVLNAQSATFGKVTTTGDQTYGNGAASTIGSSGVTLTGDLSGANISVNANVTIAPVAGRVATNTTIAVGATGAVTMAHPGATVDTIVDATANTDSLVVTVAAGGGAITMGQIGSATQALQSVSLTDNATSGGNITLFGTVTTKNNQIYQSGTGGTTTLDNTLSANTAGATISINNTALVAASGGTITLTGNSAANIITLATVNAAATSNTLALTAGTTGGTINLNGSVGANGTSFASVTTTSNTLNLLQSSGLSVATSGAQTYNANVISLGGTLIESGTSGLTLGNANAAITLAADATISTTSGGTVNVDGTSGTTGTLAGAGYGLALIGSSSAGGETIWGTVTGLTGLVVTNGLAVDFKQAVTVTTAKAGGSGFTAQTVALGSSSGESTVFEKTLTATNLTVSGGAYSVSLTGAAITNAVTFNNTGGLTLDGSNATSQGQVLFQSGATVVAADNTTLTGTIASNGGAVALNGAITLTGTTVLDTTNAGTSVAGANLTTATINGAQALTLNAGTGGVIADNGAIGGTSPLASLTVNNAGSATFQKVATSGSQTYGTVASLGSFASGGVTLDGDLTTSAGNIALNGNVTLAPQSGQVASGTTITVTSTAGTVSLANQSGTVGAINDSAADTNSLTVAASGAITLGSIGQSTAINVVKLTSTAGNITMLGAVKTKGNQTYTSQGTTGTTTLNGTLATDGTAASGVTISINNTAVFTGTSGTVSLGNDVSGNTISLNTVSEATNNTHDLALSAGVNNGVINLTGSIGASGTAFKTVTTTSKTLNLLQNAGLAVYSVGAQTYNADTIAIGGTLNIASNTNLVVGNANAAITLSADTTLDSATAGGAVSLGRTAAGGTVTGQSHTLLLKGFTSSSAATVYGTVSGLANLTVTGGSAIDFKRTVGATVVTLTAANAGTVTFEQALTATNLTANANSYAVSLTGGTITSGTTTGNAVVFNNTGGVTLDGGTTQGAILFTNGVTSTASTAGAASGPAATTLKGTIDTQGKAIHLGTTLLAADTTLDTTNNGGASGGAAIDTTTLTAAADETIDGAYNFKVNAGTTGAVSFGQIGGATALRTVDLTGVSLSLTSTRTTANQDYHAPLTINKIAGTSGAATVATLNTTANGSIAIDNTRLVTLATDTTIATAGTGSISLGQIAGGGNNLTLNSNTSLSVGVTATDTTTGGVAGVGTLSIISQTGATFYNTVGAGTVAISASAGTDTFQDSVTATSFTIDGSPVTLILTGATITSAVTFNNTSGVTLDGRPSGTNGRAGAGTILLTGGFTSTASTTYLYGTIDTNGSAATTQNVVLKADTTIDLTNGGAAGGGSTLTVQGTIDDFAVNAGGLWVKAGTGGTATFKGAIGAGVPINSLIVTADSIATQSTVTTSGSAGQDYDTSAGTSAKSYTAAAALTANGAGSIVVNTTTNDFAGTVTANGGDIIVTGTTTLKDSGGTNLFDTSAGTGFIALNNIVGQAGTQNLTFAASSGIIYVGGTVGTLNTLTLNSTGGATFQKDVSVTNVNIKTVTSGAVRTANPGSDTTVASEITTLTGLTSDSATAGNADKLSTIIADRVRFLGNLTATTVSDVSAATYGLDFIGPTTTITTTNFSGTSGSSVTLANTVTMDTTADATLTHGLATTRSLSLWNTTLVTANAMVGVGANAGGTSVAAYSIGTTVAPTGAVVVNSASTITTNGTNFVAASVDGPGALTVNAGAGNALVTGGVGVSTPLNSLTVTAVTTELDSSVTTSGTQLYTGNLILGGPSGAIVRSLSADITTAGPGNIQLLNDVTISASKNLLINGSVDAGSTVSGTFTKHNLTLGIYPSDAPSIDVKGTMINLKNLTLINSSSALFEGFVSIDQNPDGASANGHLAIGTNNVTSGPITFAAGGQSYYLDTATAPYVLTLNGFTDIQKTTILNGTTYLTSNNTFTNGVSSTGNVFVNGKLTTDGFTIQFNQITITKDSIISTTGNGAPGADIIALSKTTSGIETDGTGSYNLTLDSGVGGIFLGTIGVKTSIDNLTATGATIALQSVTTMGNQVVKGLITLTGDLKSGGSVLLDGDTSITGTANSASTFTVNGNLFLGGGSITAGGNIAVTKTTTLGTGTGTITSSGSVTLGNVTGSGSINVKGAAISVGNVTSTGAQIYTSPSTTVGGTLSGGAITATGALVLSRDTGINTSSGGVMAQSITGGGHALSISSAGGLSVGGSATGIGNLVINVAQAVSIGGSLGAGNITVQHIGGGKFAIAGALTASSFTNSAEGYALSFLGGTVGSGVSFLNTGGLTINGDFSVGGALSYVANGATLSGSIQANGPITFGQITLTGAAALNASDNAISFGAVSGAGPFDVNAGSGTISIAGSVVTVGEQSYTGGTIDSVGGLFQTSAPGAAISFLGDLLLTGNVSIDTSNGNGNVYFKGLDSLSAGASDTRISVGNGYVYFGAVGQDPAIGNLSVVSAGSTTVFLDDVLARSIDIEGASVLAQSVTLSTAPFGGSINLVGPLTANNYSLSILTGGGSASADIRKTTTALVADDLTGAPAVAPGTGKTNLALSIGSGTIDGSVDSVKVSSLSGAINLNLDVAGDASVTGASSVSGKLSAKTLTLGNTLADVAATVNGSTGELAAALVTNAYAPGLQVVNGVNLNDRGKLDALLKGNSTLNQILNSSTPPATTSSSSSSSSGSGGVSGLGTDKDQTDSTKSAQGGDSKVLIPGLLSQQIAATGYRPPGVPGVGQSFSTLGNRSNW